MKAEQHGRCCAGHFHVLFNSQCWEVERVCGGQNPTMTPPNSHPLALVAIAPLMGLPLPVPAVILYFSGLTPWLLRDRSWKSWATGTSCAFASGRDREVPQGSWEQRSWKWARRWHLLARGGRGAGRGQESAPAPAPTMGDALAAAQPNARCSLQTGRKQTRETFLQNYQLPAIPYSRPPRPRKTDQQRTAPPSGLTDFIQLFRKPWEEKWTAQNKQGHVHFQSVTGSRNVLAGRFSEDHFAAEKTKAREGKWFALNHTGELWQSLAYGPSLLCLL